MNVLADVQVLERTDADGRYLIDDGLQISWTVTDLKIAWGTSPDIDPCGSNWDPKLIDLFENGMDVVFVQYVDDSKDSRQIWQAGRHDETNNKVRYTSLYTFHQIGTKALRPSVMIFTCRTRTRLYI